MNRYCKLVAFHLLLAVSMSGANAFANDVSKAEFIKVTKYMMMEPCTVQAYMNCLGIKMDFCKKAVRASFKTCDGSVKIPNKIPRNDIQGVINNYGICMTDQITTRMKLTPKKLDKCETVLRANMKKPESK